MKKQCLSIIRSWACRDVTDITDNRLTLGDSDSLPEYSEPMSLNDNEGYATREIFNNNDDSIINNSINDL